MRLRSVLAFLSGMISLIRLKRIPGNSMISGWNGVEVSRQDVRNTINVLPW